MDLEYAAPGLAGIQKAPASGYKRVHRFGSNTYSSRSVADGMIKSSFIHPLASRCSVPPFLSQTAIAIVERSAYRIHSTSHKDSALCSPFCYRYSKFNFFTLKGSPDRLHLDDLILI